MKISRLSAYLVVSALLFACSGEQEAAVEPEADTSAAASETPPPSVVANDGGIPLSAPDQAAADQYMVVRDQADRGNFIEANQAARQLTESYPNFAGGWIMLGNTALSGSQFVQSTKKAQELAASGTEGEKLWADINMTFVSNDSDQGLALGRQLTERYPDSPRAHIVYSFQLANVNRHDEARASIEKAIALASDQAFAYNAAGFSYLYNDPKDFAKAEAAFKHATELQPDEDNNWVNLGDVHRAMGDLEAARGDYSSALEQDANNSVAAVKRGHVNSFLGNYDEARADYTMGIGTGQEGNQSTLTNYRAFVNLHAGDHEAAVEELKAELGRLDSLDMPTDQKVGARTFLLTNITDICFNYDMLDEAAGAADMLSASFAESGANSGDENFARQQKATAAFWSGKLAARQGDFDAANAKAAEFAELVAADTNPRKLERQHELLGLIALQQGDYDAAIEHYRQANLSTSPGGGDIKNIYMLAKALQGAGHADEAAALMQKVANWNFNSVWFAMLRGDAGSSG